MSSIAPPKSGKPLQVASELARVWGQAADQSQVRMINAASALVQVGNAANYALARCPRVMAAQSIAGADAYSASASADPLWLWCNNDTAANGRTRYIHVLALPRENAPGGGGDEEIHRYGDTADTTGAQQSSTNVTSSPSYPADLQHHVITHERGARADALEAHGVSALNGATVCGVVVQDVALPLLDTSLHDYVPLRFRPGDKCTELYIEKLREAIQLAREDYLPILAAWSANDPLGANMPTASDETGYVVEALSYTNFLDGSSTSRSASTPGVSCHVQYAGHGPASTNAGKKVRVAWSVWAATDDPIAADILVQASSSFANNTSSVAVSGTTPTRYDGASVVYLDAATADDDATTARNKIDIFGKTDTEGGHSVWLYGWSFRMEHE
jgi:hypothetical protein